MFGFSTYATAARQYARICSSSFASARRWRSVGGNFRNSRIVIRVCQFNVAPRKRKTNPESIIFLTFLIFKPIPPFAKYIYVYMHCQTNNKAMGAKVVFKPCKSGEQKEMCEAVPIVSIRSSGRYKSSFKSKILFAKVVVKPAPKSCLTLHLEISISATDHYMIYCGTKKKKQKTISCILPVS